MGKVPRSQDAPQTQEVSVRGLAQEPKLGTRVREPQWMAPEVWKPSWEEPADEPAAQAKWYSGSAAERLAGTESRALNWARAENAVEAVALPSGWGLARGPSGLLKRAEDRWSERKASSPPTWKATKRDR